MARIDPSTSQFMDTARWVSALAVVLAHTLSIMMVDDVLVPHPGGLMQLMFALKNVGHLAVVVFFVLSGYLVGGQEWLRVKAGRQFDAGRYAIQRFSRIYTVLVPALLLTLALDTAGRHLFADGALYTAPIPNVGSVGYSILGHDDPITFAGNLLMLQTIAVPPLGGDGPLWSLANEWWYYVGFGLVLIAVADDQPRPWRFVALLALVGLLLALPLTIVLLSSVWLVGVAAAVLDRRWRGLQPRPALAVLAAGCLCAVWCMSWANALDALPRLAADLGHLAIDLVPALAFAVALVSMKNAIRRGDGRLHQVLAGFSFSLYAVHFPTLLFLCAAASTLFGLRWGRPFDAVCISATIGLTACICLLAWMFAHLTERHTPAVRRAMTGLVQRTADTG